MAKRIKLPKRLFIRAEEDRDDVFYIFDEEMANLGLTPGETARVGVYELVDVQTVEVQVVVKTTQRKDTFNALGAKKK